jgi:ATP-binding cassette subfamily B protein
MKQHPIAPPDRPLLWRRVRTTLSFARHQRWGIAVTLMLSVTVAIITTFEPLVMRDLIDGVSRRAGTAALVRGAVILTGLLVVHQAFASIVSWLGWRCRLGVQRALLDATVGRLHTLPLSYHNSQPAGGLMTRIDRGVQGLTAALSELAFSVFPAVVYLVFSTVAMARLHGAMTLAILVVLPLPAFIGMWAASSQTVRDGALLDRWGRIYARFNEALSGIATVKSFSMEHEEKRRFMRDVDAANELVIRGVGFDAQVGAAQNLITGGARILVVAYGGVLALTGQLSVGTLLAFLGYLGGLLGPVQALTGVYQTLRRAAVSLTTVFSILEAEDHVPEAKDARDLPSVRGDVAFVGIGFAYGAGRPVLHDIDIQIPAGQTLALVGPSGGGKTTLMGLLQRLHDPQQGHVSIDGRDVRTVTQGSLRRHIGAVMQDPLLFDDSIAANIAYGRPEASAAEIEAAARGANAHEFIMNLPHGYDSAVGQRGVLLSAGQRQRIAIARVLLKDPPIVILDEATSALDAESEAQVQEAFDRLLVGRTTFVIAHRLSTVVRADRIVVLHGGRIIESGTHAELLRTDSYYASLVDLQTSALLIPSAA